MYVSSIMFIALLSDILPFFLRKLILKRSDIAKKKKVVL